MPDRALPGPPRDKEVVAMPQWPIRVKLIAGLSLVVGMMLTLMGGSIFGLHAFHTSNLTLVDQLRELGASKDLLQVVVRLEAPRHGTPEESRALVRKVKDAQTALIAYFEELNKNTTRGSRADDGRDEMGLAFAIDIDLAAILAELGAGPKGRYMLPRTSFYLSRHAKSKEASGTVTAGIDGPESASGLESAIHLLNRSAMQLPNKLHRDFYAVLLTSQRQSQTSRVIV